MRRESVAWERAAEVREAAEGWRRVGAIDAPTEEAIRAAFPDPCLTPSPVWRVLTAAMVTAVVLCAYGAFWIAAHPGTTALQVLLFLFGVACLVTTERLEASPRLARRGAAGATGLLGVGFVLVGFGVFLVDTLGIHRHEIAAVFLGTSALAWGASSWRWGSPVSAALSAV